MIRHIAMIAFVTMAVLLTALVFSLPVPDSGDAPSGGAPATFEPDTDETGAAGAQTPGNTATLLIENVRVLDNGSLSPRQSVLVRDGIIAQLGAPTAEDGTPTIDGAGATLLPGLIDSHTHSYGSSLADALRFGVTINLDMFADRGLLMLARQSRLQRGPSQEADLWSAGMLATAPGGHGTQYGVSVEPIEAVAQVPAWVAERKAEGSDYIKLVYMPKARAIPSIDRDIARAVIEAAHQEGLLALAHISTQEGARHMVEDGIDGLVHIFADSPVDDAFLELAKTSGVFIIPTLAVVETINGMADTSALINDAEKAELLSPMQAQTLNANFGAGLPGFDLAIALSNVRQLKAAGVEVLAGSDAPNPGTAQGLSLHRELQLLVQAGLSEAEALAAASSVPAALFSLPGRGHVREGARADFLLVEGNPLEDIRQTLAIVDVFKNGHRIARIPNEGTRSAALAAESLGDFESAMVAPQGFGWTSTDDQMVNGASEVSIERIAGGAGGSGHALRIDAVVRTGFPYPWAGGAIMSSEGADISRFRAVQFDVRGTPGRYRLMGFNLGAMGIPPTFNFPVTDPWQTHTIPLAELDGLDTGNFIGFAWVAGPDAGESTLFLDNVRLLK